MEGMKSYLDKLYYWLVLGFVFEMWQLLQQGAVNALEL